MARESQGLQIALIVFVMLSIILGVTTYIFYRQYEEANAKTVAAMNDKKTANDEKDRSEKDNEALRQLIGVATTEAMADVDSKVNAEMNAYGGQTYQGKKNLREMLKYVFNVVHDKDKDIRKLTTNNEDLNAKLKAREAAAVPQVTEWKTKFDGVAKDNDEQRKKFEDERGKIATEKEDLAGQLDKAQKDGQAALVKLQDQLTGLKKQVRDSIEKFKQKDEEVVKLTKPTFEVADGKIAWVSQREGVVWINLGQADALPNLATFSVYAADTSNVSGAERKASIEVTEVVGPHLAKARILEDRVADPIVPGDVIHTPIWAPGEKKHFALVGVIDIDGDGKSDLQKVLALIRTNGGEVDCYQDEKGLKQGKISSQTTYLVKGAEPKFGGVTSNADEEKRWMDVFTAMDREADKNLLKKMTLSDLLKSMGWKDTGRLVTYGPGAPASQFKATLPPGGQRVSPGTVSPLFKPREVPRATPATAY